MAFSRITSSTSTTRRTRSKPQKRISLQNRHPLPLCLLRILQLLIALIALSAFASYLTNLPTAITRANGVSIGIIASSFFYAAVTSFTVFCVPYGSYVLSVIMTVLDWVFVVGWVAVGVLSKPTNKCGRGTGKVGRRQVRGGGGDGDGESDDEDDDAPGEGVSSSRIGGPSVTAAPTSTQGLAVTTTSVSSALETGASSIPNPSGVPTTLIPSQSTIQTPSQSVLVPTSGVNPSSTISTSMPTGISTGANGLPTGANGLPTELALGQVTVEVGISHGDCNLAMAVFVLAIISVILYFASIFAPCACPPRKEEVEVEDVFTEEVFEKKSVDGEGSVWSGSNDHVHDVTLAGGAWARSAII